jgi:hypothetical protein
LVPPLLPLVRTIKLLSTSGEQLIADMLFIVRFWQLRDHP